MKLNKKVAAISGLAVLAAVGGTWAFYNQTAAITNPFSTTSYNSAMVEHFNPAEGEEWNPGGEIDKTVAAKNTGKGDILVRIKMDETWFRTAEDGGNGDTLAIIGSDNKPQFSSATVDNAKQNDAKDGLVAGYTSKDAIGDFTGMDETVVVKSINIAAGANGQWIASDDGYWYWNQILKTDATTDNLLQSVTLAKDTDMGNHLTSYKFIIKEKGGSEPTDEEWAAVAITYETQAEMKEAIKAELNGDTTKEVFMNSQNTAENPGYSNANYDLAITTEFLQATNEALGEWTGEIPQEVKDLVPAKN